MKKRTPRHALSTSPVTAIINGVVNEPSGSTSRSSKRQRRGAPRFHFAVFLEPERSGAGSAALFGRCWKPETPTTMQKRNIHANSVSQRVRSSRRRPRQRHNTTIIMPKQKNHGGEPTCWVN